MRARNRPLPVRRAEGDDGLEDHAVAIDEEHVDRRLEARAVHARSLGHPESLARMERRGDPSRENLRIASELDSRGEERLSSFVQGEDHGRITIRFASPVRPRGPFPSREGRETSLELLVLQPVCLRHQRDNCQRNQTLEPGSPPGVFRRMSHTDAGNDGFLRTLEPALTPLRAAVSFPRP